MTSAVRGAPLLPVKPISCNPFRPLVQLVRAVAGAVLGYLLRITVFQMGEMKVPGARLIMRTYQRLTYDPRERKPLDHGRLSHSKSLLVSFGGEEVALPTADGKATVRCLTFKPERFFAHFEQMGARKTDIVYQGEARHALLPADRFLLPEYAPMREAFQKAARKFRFPLIDIQTNHGIVKGALLPESPQLAPGAQPPIVLHAHSPGRSMAMERLFIGLLLAAGYPVAIYDPRGTAESKGRISEGGAYLDIEAVYHHVRALGYTPDRIYASGFCEGAAMAAHLKRKFHHEGIHYVGANPFDSMQNLVGNHGRLFKWLAPLALPALKTKDPRARALVQEDGLDTVAKFAGLPRSNGKFILISTDKDSTVPKGSAERIAQAAGDAGPVTHIVRAFAHKKIKNAHTQPPYEDRNVWRRLIEVMV